jgi:hypothetical protein
MPALWEPRLGPKHSFVFLKTHLAVIERVFFTLPLNGRFFVSSKQSQAVLAVIFRNEEM